MFGSATAAALAKRGLRTVALDRYRPPHALGSSHGGSRIIRRVYAEGALYGELVERAFAGWRALAEESGRELLLTTGGLTLGEPDGTLVAGALDSAERHGLRHELLDADQLRRRRPAFRLPSGQVAVSDPEAGVLRLEACLTALLERAAAAGAELWFDCPLESWSAAGGSFELATPRGRVTAGSLVLALGPWSGQLAPPLAVARQVQHWFEPAEAGCGPDRLPVFVWQLADGRIWYGLPDLGDGVKAALHHGGAAFDVETVERAVAPAEIEAVQRLMARYLPPAAGRWRRSAVCLYTNTGDLRFSAGPLAAQPGAWLVTGGSGHGFKFAPALGELVAEGIARRVTPAALEPFLPDRPAAAAGGTG